MLARLERENGLQSICMYEWEICNGKVDGADCVLKLKMGRLYVLRIILFYLLTARYFDIYHFNWGSTLIRSETKWYDQLDLPILKLLRKKIVVTFQGTDCRQADVALKKYKYIWYRDMPAEELKETLSKDPMRRRRIGKFDKYADTMYCNTADLKDMLPERTIYRIHTKLKLNEWEPAYSDYSKPVLTLLHAPTNRLVKGTKYIIDAVNKLADEGYPVKLCLVENMSNAEAKKLYMQCDIAIDQLYVWFGGFTLEMWALGKPLICGIRKENLIYFPRDAARELPCINANPDNIYDVLKQLIADRLRLDNIAHQSRAFVEKWYDCEISIKPIIENYENILYKRQ